MVLSSAILVLCPVIKTHSYQLLGMVSHHSVALPSFAPPVFLEAPIYPS
jgi:hypothetical protein